MPGAIGLSITDMICTMLVRACPYQQVSGRPPSTSEVKEVGQKGDEDEARR
jgi:hypothetical protein